MTKQLDLNSLQHNANLNFMQNKVVSGAGITGPDFRKACLNFLRPDIDLVLITNHSGKPNSQESFYSFSIENDKLRIVESSPVSKRDINYTMEHGEYFINGQKQDKNFEQEFVKKINKIGRDMQQGKTFIFERPAKEGK